MFLRHFWLHIDIAARMNEKFVNLNKLVEKFHTTLKHVRIVKNLFH